MTIRPPLKGAFSLPGLNACVGSKEEFEAQYWQIRPALFEAVSTPALSFSDIIELPRVKEMLTSRELRGPQVRVVIDGTNRPIKSFCESTTIGGVQIHDVVSPPRLAKALSDGATIVLDDVNEYLPSVRTTCRAIAAELGQPAQASVYITPAGLRGFKPHYDREHVLVLQLQGKKHWRVYDRVRRFSPHAGGVDPESVGDPLIDTVLTPGDSLYIPSGYPHVAESSPGETSIHLTVGIRVRTWRELLQQAAAEALSDDIYDEETPPFYFKEGTATLDQISRHLDELGRIISSMASQEVASAFAATPLSALNTFTSDSFDSTEREAIANGTELAFSDLVSARVTRVGPDLMLEIGSRSFIVSAQLADSLERVAYRPRFSLRDLQAEDGTPVPAGFVELLMREGLLVKAP